MRLLLIDGHYYAYRSFFAIRNLSNSRREPTNAVYGFVKTLKKMVADLQPDLAAVVLDGGLPQERLTLQPEYKANRSEMPEEMSQQMPWIEAAISALGFVKLCVEGEEADDVMASYTVAATQMGYEVVLATNDKDLMQLVNDRVRVYQTKNAEFALLGVQEVEEKWGVPPEKIGDVLALTGDAVDNIPGIPGVGPKTAANWIRQFGSLEMLLTHAAAIKNEKLRGAIEASRAQIESNRDMVRLRTGLMLPMKMEDLKIKPDLLRQVELFQRMEFKTFLAEAKAALPKAAAANGSQQELF